MAASLTLSALVAHSAQQLETAHAAGQLSFGQGTTNADDEAAWLVLWRLGLALDIDWSDPAYDVAVLPEQVANVQALIQHRIDSRQPAAYLTQEAWLQGVSFFIDERAIVPRSLIAEVLAEGASTPGCPPTPRACLTCALATAAWASWLPWRFQTSLWWVWTCHKTRWMWRASTSNAMACMRA